MTPDLTYVYCLVAGQRRPAVARLPAGVPNAGPTRVIEAGGALWLVVASARADAYSAAALAEGLRDLDWVARHALAHEAVVERFLRAKALVPMQLFTLFTSDARALAHVRRRRRALDRVLARVEGCAEWGLRVSWRPQRAPRPRQTRRQPASGAAYLAATRDRLAGARHAAAATRAEAVRAYAALSKTTRAARRRTDTESAPGSQVLLDGAFLVPRSGAVRFRTAVRRHAGAIEALGGDVSLTGPWPPYHFAMPGRAR